MTIKKVINFDTIKEHHAVMETTITEIIPEHFPATGPANPVTVFVLYRGREYAVSYNTHTGYGIYDAKGVAEKAAEALTSYDDRKRVLFFDEKLDCGCYLIGSEIVR